MAIKLYTDEHVHPAVVNALRRRGVDVFTAQEADMLGVPDAQHLQFSNSQSRVIFTQDSDFLRLHNSGASHAGIIYAHQSVPVGKMVQGLLLIYQILSEEEMENHIEYL